MKMIHLKPAKLLKSCDTFVVLPPATANGCIIFGKNSDRPAGEVQEIIYEPAQDRPEGSKVQCTYIEIDQVPRTNAVILSKPSWMWGAEMGANEHGVCIGNEAVWTKLNGPDDHDECLLGMDLVRLGLERAGSAKEALDVITSLLETHGQGGPCSDVNPMFTYHNSFLIVDRKEAWVLETAGKHWAAEQVTDGYRNISNCLTITTKIDAKSSDLINFAQSSNFWDSSEGEFDFTKAYGDNGSDCTRYRHGRLLLGTLSASSNFSIMDMITVLRDKEIAMNGEDTSTASSQVSVLTPLDSHRPCCHWFTGTPDPCSSVFKPFIFGPKVQISPHIQSPVIPDGEDPAKVIPRFQNQVDRRHNLYKLHEKVCGGKQNDELKAVLRDLEEKCIRETEAFLDKFTESSYAEVEDLFKDVVESEMKFYK